MKTTAGPAREGIGHAQQHWQRCQRWQHLAALPTLAAALCIGLGAVAAPRQADAVRTAHGGATVLLTAASSRTPTETVTSTSSTHPSSAQPSKPAQATKHRKNANPPTSGESRSERDKRLQRECKGKPNAGLCEGYAH